MQISASYRNILKISLPIIIANFAQNIINVTDLIFLGRVSEVEQGACGLISTYYLVMVMIGMGFSRGGQILIARRAGENQHREIGSITTNLFYSKMLMAAILCLFLLIGSPYVLKLFINTAEIYTASLAYLKYRSYGLFFSYFGFVLMSLYTSIGRTRLIGIVMAIVGLSNILFNYTLVLGKFGFPAMGIEGAGLASTLAEAFGMLVGMFLVFFDRTLNKFNLFRLHPIVANIQKQMSKLSAPLVVQFMVGLGGWFVFLSFIENMGEQALAISVVLKVLYTTLTIPSWGLSSSINSIVSNLIGQKKYKSVQVSMYRTSLLSLIFSIVCCLLIVGFQDTIIPFLTPNEAVVAGTKKLLPELYAIIIICSISTIVFNTLVGTGATMISFAFEAAIIVVYLGYAYFIVNFTNLGLGYVWVAEFLYWFLLLIPSFWYMKSEKWKKLNV